MHNKATSLKESFTRFKLEDLYNNYENKYQHNLSSACMPIMALKDILNTAELESLTKEIISSKLDYCDKNGRPQSQDALITSLYPSLEAESIITTSGASEAIYLVMKSLFTKDDQIIVQRPIYQSLFQVAQDSGAQVIDWYLNDDAWCFDELKSLIKKYPETKALVMNNPNNPTGRAFTKDELETIIEIIGSRLLICDEVFQPLSLSDCPSISSLSENSISICDLSKSFSAPGLRLGWVLTKRKDLIEKFISFKSYLSLRTNIISEIITPYILEKRDLILNKNKEILKENIDKLYSLKQEDLFFDLDIKKEDIDCLCIFPKLKDEFIDLNFEKLIQEKSLFLAMGENFGPEYKEHCRIGLGNFNLQAITSFASETKQSIH